MAPPCWPPAAPAVVALEEDEDLLRIARAVLPAVVPGRRSAMQPDPVQIVSGPLAAGWRAGRAVRPGVHRGRLRDLPAAIAEQVRPDGGRLVGVRVLGRAGRPGRAWASGSGAAPAISLRPAFDCAAPVLPGLRRAPGFVF